MPCKFVERAGEFSTVRMVDGTVLRTLSGPTAAGGGDMMLSIRPENLGLASVQSSPGANRIKGTVYGVFFLGDHMRLTVEAFDRQSLTARIPARRARHFAPGDHVDLECSISDCRLLEA